MAGHASCGHAGPLTPLGVVSTSSNVGALGCRLSVCVAAGAWSVFIAAAAPAFNLDLGLHLIRFEGSCTPCVSCCAGAWSGGMAAAAAAPNLFHLTQCGLLHPGVCVAAGVLSKLLQVSYPSLWRQQQHPSTLAFGFRLTQCGGSCIPYMFVMLQVPGLSSRRRRQQPPTLTFEIPPDSTWALLYAVRVVLLQVPGLSSWRQLQQPPTLTA
jgi:hypothetical protein